MNGRHVAAQSRVQQFVKVFRGSRHGGVILRVKVDNEVSDLLLTDLETILKPRVVVHNLGELQALAVGSIILTQGDRAAQVEAAELWDLDTGAEIEAKRLLYAGTDLYDNLLPDPSKEERDTLRRMLPAIVIHPLD